MKIILGIDPGSLFTGFGLVKSDGSRIEHLSHGVIAAPSSIDFHERIGIISREIEALIQRTKPDIAVIERIFLGKNADSAFKLGHARGVAMAAAVRADCEFVEYAARAVKKGITGSGTSSKEQVQLVLFAALGIRSGASADASDALALAYYHARNIEVAAGLQRSKERHP
ncbi:MAG: crossover junction endodeoxyribonuclease RuvC [Bdellovibrionota bacterium]